MDINQFALQAVLPTAAETQALVPYDGTGPTPDVLKIMKRVVEPKSQQKYTNELIRFILWIYDGDEVIRDLLLEEWFTIKLDWTAVEDHGSRSRKVTCKVCRDAIDFINKASNNCPIILPSLTVNIFAHYLTTQRKKDSTYL